MAELCKGIAVPTDLAVRRALEKVQLLVFGSVSFSQSVGQPGIKAETYLSAHALQRPSLFSQLFTPCIRLLGMRFMLVRSIR